MEQAGRQSPVSRGVPVPRTREGEIHSELCGELPLGSEMSRESIALSVSLRLIPHHELYTLYGFERRRAPEVGGDDAEMARMIPRLDEGNFRESVKG